MIMYRVANARITTNFLLEKKCKPKDHRMKSLTYKRQKRKQKTKQKKSVKLKFYT